MGVVESADVLAIGEPASRFLEFSEISVDLGIADFDRVHLHAQKGEQPLLVLQLVRAETVLVRVEAVHVVRDQLFHGEQLFVD